MDDRMVAGLVLALSAGAAGCWPFVADHCELGCPSGATGTGAGGAGGDGGTGGAGGGAAIDLFVDPVAGNDANPGTEDAPLKTLKRALATAGSGATVHLFAGTFDAASGEDFDSPVSDGVTVAAIIPGEAILSGSGIETALLFEGSGAAQGLSIEGFGVGIAAQAGAVALVGVELAGNAVAMSLAGAAAVSMTASVIRDGAAGVELHDGAILTMRGGEIRGIGESCGATVARAADAGRIEMESALVHDSLGVVVLSESARLRIVGGALSAVGCGTAILALHGTLVDIRDAAMIQAAMGGVPGALISAGSEAEVVLAGGNVFALSTAVEGGDKVSIDGVTILGADTFEPAVSPGFGAVTSVKDTAIEGFGVGVEVAGGQARVRGCDLSGNGIGVRTVSGLVDMGTEMDPGGNRLLQSAQAGLFVSGAGGLVHEAVGNTWIASNQGTDLNGHFPPGTTVTGPYGTSGAAPHNVVIQSAGESVRLAAP